MSKITDALAKLDPANDNHWTSDGLPRIDTVRMLAADQTLSRELITAEAPDFSRSNAAPVVVAAPLTPAVVAATVAAVAQAVAEPVAAVAAVVEPELVATTGEATVLSAADYDLLIEQAQKALQEAINVRNAAQTDVEVAQNELDSIINEKHDAGAGTSTADTIQGYLASQQSDLTERGRRAKVLQESGVTLRDIQALIPQASPLDQALTSKKR